MRKLARDERTCPDVQAIPVAFPPIGASIRYVATCEVTQWAGSGRATVKEALRDARAYGRANGTTPIVEWVSLCGTCSSIYQCCFGSFGWRLILPPGPEVCMD